MIEWNSLITYVINTLLFTIGVSLFDGYCTTLRDGTTYDYGYDCTCCKVGIPHVHACPRAPIKKLITNIVSMKFLKYFIFISGVLFFIRQWIIIYFYLDARIVKMEKLLDVDVFNHQDTFAYRAIALSSYSNLIFFFTIQLYRHIKHPNRINTIPTLIEMKQIDFNDASIVEHGHGHAHAQNHNSRFSASARNIQSINTNEDTSDNTLNVQEISIDDDDISIIDYYKYSSNGNIDIDNDPQIDMHNRSVTLIKQKTL